MTTDATPSIWTRILNWLLSWSRKRDAQASADTTQQHHLEEQTHAVEQAQDHAPADVSEFARRVRDGDAL